MPLLIWPDAVILVVPDDLQQRLIQVEIPRLRQWISTPKPIHVGDSWPGDHFTGILLTSPQAWLCDRLYNQGKFPPNIPTVFDNADDLETWGRAALNVQIKPQDWDRLMLAYPEHGDAIRDIRIQLTRIIFQHPENPYGCHVLDQPEQKALHHLRHLLLASTQIQHQSMAALTPDPVPDDRMPAPWQPFWQMFRSSNTFTWTAIDRLHGQFTLHCDFADVSTKLAPVWEQQPIVLIGGALDLESEAPTYRQRLGLGDMTCLKFSPQRQHDLIQLYIPDRMPMPNQPQFQAALMSEIRSLLHISADVQGTTIVLVGDMPLKNRVGTSLAAEFGSRVKVERTGLDDNGILVSGWEFWRQHQGVLPTPSLLIIATLPLPSLEHPLVAGRVAYYKKQRQDWFRLYLLPEALSELQRAIAPIRRSQGVVALLDNRVNHRSYGQQVLSSLSPAARLNYVDITLFDEQRELER